ncbi:hypothetical protein [Liquorilactobacillus uvarum]|nr:hypothetical protein [Liquorilactobacillus uvarum]
MDGLKELNYFLDFFKRQDPETQAKLIKQLEGENKNDGSKSQKV